VSCSLFAARLPRQRAPANPPAGAGPPRWTAQRGAPSLAPMTLTYRTRQTQDTRTQNTRAQNTRAQDTRAQNTRLRQHHPRMGCANPLDGAAGRPRPDGCLLGGIVRDKPGLGRRTGRGRGRFLSLRRRRHRRALHCPRGQEKRRRQASSGPCPGGVRPDRRLGLSGQHRSAEVLSAGRACRDLPGNGGELPVGECRTPLDPADVAVGLKHLAGGGFLSRADRARSPAFLQSTRAP